MHIGMWLLPGSTSFFVNFPHYQTCQDLEKETYLNIRYSYDSRIHGGI